MEQNGAMVSLLTGAVLPRASWSLSRKDSGHAGKLHIIMYIIV